MVFSSAVFVFVFFPISLILYYICSSIGIKVQNALLLVLSFIFYSWGEPKNVLWLLLAILISYSYGILFKRTDKKRLLLILFTVLELLILFYFKYVDFIIRNINALTGAALPLWGIVPAAGVSFFIFKCISYMADVYKGRTEPERNMFYYSLYVSFFPQIMAGPITRFKEFGPQLRNRACSTDRIFSGAVRFMTGFGKKVLLSDTLSAYVTNAFQHEGYSALAAWISIAGYLLMLYFDFSGYSDMAIGIGEMMGFDTPENFNYPFTADSVRDFWRRWHMSLSGWFREYVYIPLGGSKKGLLRTVINTFIVFILTGLWHGSSWNFVIWGLLQAAAISFERILEKRGVKIPEFLRHLYFLLILAAGFIFFASPGARAGFSYLGNLFDFKGNLMGDLYKVSSPQYMIVLAMGILCASGALKKPVDHIKKRPLAVGICAILIFILASVYMWGSGYVPFIYYKF